MGNSVPHVTSAELRILKVLWRHGPQTVRQVKEALSPQDGDPPAYTTVMTLMKQLADKGALTVDRAQQTFVYAPAIGRKQVLEQRLAQFLHTVFDDKVDDMVLQLVDAANLSVEDLRRIESKITAREKDDTKRRPRRAGSKGKST
jgi:predicted transcriptional regulator